MNVPGENLLIKMWDSLADRGIGGLLKPWQIRREARAQVETRTTELLLLAQAEKQAEEIRAGKKKVVESGGRLLLLSNEAEVVDGRVEPELEISRLLLAAEESKSADALREEINVAKTILQAEQMLIEDSAEPSEQSIEVDWLYRWRDSAAQVSTDELQSLWAKVLAGEVKSPGAYSLRTLDFLRNLSRAEAEEIQRLCPYVVNGQCILMYGDMATAPDASIDFPLRMQELGILSGVGGLGLTMTWKHNGAGNLFQVPLMMNGRVVIARTSDINKVLGLNMYRITPLGMQVLALNQAVPSEGYVRAVAEGVKSLGFEAFVGTPIPVFGNPGAFHWANLQSV